MITITIRYISLVRLDGQGKGAKVLFPPEKHALQIKRENGDTIATGHSIILEAWSGSTPVPPQEATWTANKNRVLSMKALLESVPILATGADFVDSAAQSVLFLPGGNFAGQSPHTKDPHKDSLWDLGRGKSQRLTDEVRWTDPRPLEFRLNVDGVSTKLENGEHLTFSNDDITPTKFTNNNGKAELKDVDALYELLSSPPPVPSRHYPKTDFVEELPKPLGGPPLGGDLPLCPVGTDD